MRRLVVVLMAWAALAATAPVAVAQAVREWDDQAIQSSIDRARQYILSAWKDGHWPEFSEPGAEGLSAQYGGQTALCSYALLAAGESPQHDKLKASLAWLAKLEMAGTYARAFRANAWAMLEGNSPYRRNLQQDVAWLLSSDVAGAYSYTPAQRKAGSYDNSNSQIALLGVWAGARRGIEVSDAYWRRVQKHWRENQSPDGGWSYTGPGGSYGSMTAAGLASMFICYDNLSSSAALECKFQADPAEITRGLAWMDKNFRPDSNPNGSGNYCYYLYGVERVGLASGYKYFGQKDWYKLSSQALLASQQSNGSWGGLVDTSFAMLFLSRGRHPVLFNKLEYEGAWNCRPRDLANFTRWASSTFEKELAWQIIHLGVPVSEWHDAPILYISGSTIPKFTDADLDKLRRFALEGGVILSEATDNRPEFTAAMKDIYARLFPGYELAKLPKDHPIFSQELQFDIAETKDLMGVSNGVRLLALHAAQELSRDWQTNSTSTLAGSFKLGANIYLYVTDKGILSARGVNTWPAARDFAPKGTLKIALVKHAANSDPEPLAWERLATLFGNETHVALEFSPPQEIGELNWAKWPVAIMTGTQTLDLTAQQKDALGRYVKGGGTLIVSAAGGSDAFANSSEQMLSSILPGAAFEYIQPGGPPLNLPGYVIEKVSYRSNTRKTVANPTQSRLRGIKVGDRYGVFFSRDDLVAGLVGYPCWAVKGYSPDSAYRLTRNMLLYVARKDLQEQAILPQSRQ